MKKAILAIGLLLIGLQARADGLLKPGHVMGNATGSERTATDTSFTSLLALQPFTWNGSGVMTAGTVPSGLCSFTTPYTSGAPRTCLSKMADAVSVTDCLSPTQLADVAAGTLLLDLTSTLQSCMTAAGQRQLIWPTGSYKISGTLNIPTGQNQLGDTSGAVDSGTKLVMASGVDAPFFKLNGQGAIRGFRFSGSATAGTPNQHCIYVNNTNNVVIERNFFAGCTNGVYLDGSSFYISIFDNFFYTTYASHIRVNSTTNPGVDMIVSRNRFLSLPSTASASWYFTGLGSLIASDNQMSLGTPTAGGALVYFDTPAPLFGGAQLTNNTFEKVGAASAPAIYIGGSFSAPWQYLMFANNVITGDVGNALVIAFANRLQIIGGAISSTKSTGSIYLPSFGSVTDMLVSGVDFEGSASVSPIQAQGSSGISLSLREPRWTGSAALIDFSALTAGSIGYLDITGDSFGSAATPFLLPSGSFPYTLISATKGIVAPSLPTSGGTVKGSLCVDTTGKVYVKTTAGACL